MNIIWQWYALYPTGKLEARGRWRDITYIHMQTIREEDLQQTSSGYTLLWVGAVYSEAVCISFNEPEAFYTAVKEMKKNGSIR